MSLYAQVASFSVLAGITAAAFGFVAEVIDAQSLLWAAFAVTLLCTLTSWLGFALAKVRGHEPSWIYCALLGILFVGVSTGILSLMSGALLHTSGIALAFIWLLVVAPIFVFVGSLPTKRAG